MKRFLDLTLSLVLLPLLALTVVVLVVMNPVLNPGPLFFKQTRIGRHGAPFMMYKFRSMRVDAGKAGFADAERHRINGFGQVLRRYRIDELPQMINVILGQMSLIGPRPEQAEFVRCYVQDIPRYEQRHLVRPGVSGLSQVVQGYTCDTRGTRRKLETDLRYIAQSGFRMEIYVFWRTIVTVFTGFGAR